MSVETVVEGAVASVEAEVKKIVGETTAEVAKVEAEVKPEVEKLTQAITAEEKLAIRELEVGYLKAQAEIQRLSQITSNAQKNFTTTVDELVKKYAVNPAEWVFDNVELIFKKRQ